MAHVISLHVYPLKSARGLDLTEVRVEPWGPVGDRRWMLVDADGRFVSQRDQPLLATVTVRPAADGGLVVHAPAMDELRIDIPDVTRRITVRLWRDDVEVTLCAADAHTWFGKLLGIDVRLVHLSEPGRRAVDPRYGAESDRVSLADGFPLLLTSSGSLAALNDLMDEQLPMNRFRPNVVVGGTDAWAEDTWRRVRIGDLIFRVAKPCSRCAITTTDQLTGERGREPLKSLARHRRFGRKLLFGQNLVPDLRPGGPDTLRVGDPFEVLEYRDPADSPLVL